MNLRNSLALAAIAAGGLLIAAGCTMSQSADAPGQPALLSTAGKDAKAAAPAAGKGRAQLWAENCNRCHNARSPDSYNDAEWTTVMLHMQIRANLTGEDARAILEFLKASN